MLIDSLGLRQKRYLDALLTEVNFVGLRKYTTGAWPLVESRRPYIPNWHIDAICEHLEAVAIGDIQNLIINIPPRHMKSLTVSVFWPTWMWTWMPEHQWLFSSYSSSLAIRDSVKSRNIMQSRWYQERWGDKFKFTSDQNQKSFYVNNQSGHRYATTIGGAATGEGGDTLVVDDPHKIKEAESELQRLTVTGWWDGTMTTRLNNPITGNKVIIMQRVHEADLVGHVLEKMQEGGSQYEHLKLPAEYEGDKTFTGIGFRDPRTQPNELLWSERFPKHIISEWKIDLGSRISAGQLQQRPAPEEGDVFKRAWWRYWQPKDMHLPPVIVKLGDGLFIEVPVIVLPKTFNQLLQSWDMTFKETTGTDFVVGQVWARKLAQKFLLYEVRARLSFTQTVKAVLNVTNLFPRARLKLVEDKANGPAVISYLRSKVSGLVAVNPLGGKESRANAVAPTIEAGNVFLPHPLIADWVPDWIEEQTVFPNGAFDDRVDSMSQALTRLLREEERQKKKRKGSKVIRTN
ncbi:hypothetical protein LCGC14_0914840 [marine sediment metagenome]|uniref:Terminase large subunit gp17-like C-terminal domain-containing protein n=1 Tax=marine sediment metagenome TaxID=412755 RepID=A0A0F9NSI7_9ZZZZ